MDRFDHQAFLERASVGWLESPSLDLDDHYIEVSGVVSDLPSVEALARAFEAAGFPMKQDAQRPRRDEAIFFGRVGKAKLSCKLRGLAGRKPRLFITWDSGERPPIATTELEWQGLRVPIFFDAARIDHKSSRALFIEGRVPEGDVEACLARYRAWADAQGFQADEAYEPDVATTLRVANGDYSVSIDDRGRGTLVLFVFVSHPVAR